MAEQLLPFAELGFTAVPADTQGQRLEWSA